MAGTSSAPQAPAREDVERILLAAVQRVVAEDSDLLSFNASERSITHRLALYLNNKFQDYTVDCEYNRHGLLPKSVERMQFDALRSEASQLNPTGDPDSVLIVPDLVIHRRGQDQMNLLAVEVKKSTALAGPAGDRLADFDKRKLMAYRSLAGLRYRFSAFVIFPVGAHFQAGIPAASELLPHPE